MVWRPDWHLPRKIRLELCRAGEFMDQKLWISVADQVSIFSKIPHIVFYGSETDPCKHPKLQQALDHTHRRVFPRGFIYLETTCSSMYSDPDLIFVELINRLAIYMEAGTCRIILLQRDPQVWSVIGERWDDIRLRTRERAVQEWISRTPMGVSRCMEPHTVMAVRPSGEVVVCRHDSEDELVVGDLRTQSVLSIWYGDIMRAARARAWAGLRDLGPCVGCMYRSHPQTWKKQDKLAGENLATEEHTALVRECLARSVPIVRRV